MPIKIGFEGFLYTLGKLNTDNLIPQD